MTDNCVRVDIEAVADLPTRFGRFKALAFSNNIDNEDHSAFVYGEAKGKSDVLLRIQSECVTGDVFISRRCDCREQLEAALSRITRERRGILIYLRQEGRGLGFINKIKIYKLMEEGFDTYAAAEELGLSIDKREYAVAAGVLKALGIKSVKLMTDNPEKVRGLLDNGIKVTERIPSVVKPNKYNRAYLQSKQLCVKRMLDENLAIGKFFGEGRP